LVGWDEVYLSETLVGRKGMGRYKGKIARGICMGKAMGKERERVKVGGQRGDY